VRLLASKSSKATIGSLWENFVMKTMFFVGAQTTPECDKDTFHADPGLETIMQKAAVKSLAETLMPGNSKSPFLIPDMDFYITC
jgi:hypothetical protein